MTTRLRRPLINSPRVAVDQGWPRHRENRGGAASRRVPALHAHGTSYLFAGYLDFVFADLSTKLMTYPVLPYDDSRLNVGAQGTMAMLWCQGSLRLVP